MKGVSGNSGGALTKPSTKQKIVALRENLELAIRQGPLNARRVCNVLNKMIEQAEKGDTKAAKLVLAMALHGSGSEDKSKLPDGIRIVIENATFKGAQLIEETPTVKITTSATDAEFTEIKSK